MKQKKLTKKERLTRENKRRAELRAKSKPLTFDEIREELNKSLIILGKDEDAKKEIEKFEIRENENPGHLNDQRFMQHLIGYASLKMDPPEWVLKNYYCPRPRAEKLVLEIFPYCKIEKPPVKFEEEVSESLPNVEDSEQDSDNG